MYFAPQNLAWACLCICQWPLVFVKFGFVSTMRLCCGKNVKIKESIVAVIVSH